jgi:hypothetical protein
MARQSGLFEIEGSIGNATFYKSKLDGYLVKRRSKVPKERLENDPKYIRFRENRTEYIRAMRAARLLLKPLRTAIALTLDPRVISRLSSRFSRIAKQDNISGRGERTILNGPLEQIREFEFNIGRTLASTLRADVTATMERLTGELTIGIQTFIPQAAVSAPAGATHMRFGAVGQTIDFNAGTAVKEVTYSAYVPLDATIPTAPITLTCNVTPNSILPSFLVLGIEFFDEVSGQKYALADDSHSCSQLVGFDPAP